jgi:hypothetical protein
VWDAIVLEMSNVRVAFEEYDGEMTQDGKPKGYKFVSTHMMFDVKLGENYRRKARLVADGHQERSVNKVSLTLYFSRNSRETLAKLLSEERRNFLIDRFMY